jgi:hypothetical protein
MASAICARPGCGLPAFIEPRTNIVHKYCGRTHAVEMEGRKVKPPHGDCHVCNLDGCDRNVAFDSATGRVHDFCCKDHAQEAIATGQWEKPMRARNFKGKKAKNHLPMCQLDGCRLPVYEDEESGRVHRFCGRSHAIEYKLRTNEGRSGASSASSSSAASSSSSSSSSSLSTSKSLYGPPPGAPSAAIPVPTSIPAPKISIQSVPSSKPANANNTVFRMPTTTATVPVAVRTESKNNPVSSAAASVSSSSASGSASVTSTAANEPEGRPNEAPHCRNCLEPSADPVVFQRGHICVCSKDIQTLMKTPNPKCPCCQKVVKLAQRVFGLHST